MTSNPTMCRFERFIYVQVSGELISTLFFSLNNTPHWYSTWDRTKIRLGIGNEWCCALCLPKKWRRVSCVVASRACESWRRPWVGSRARDVESSKPPYFEAPARRLSTKFPSNIRSDDLFLKFSLIFDFWPLKIFPSFTCEKAFPSPPVRVLWSSIFCIHMSRNERTAPNGENEKGCLLTWM